MIRYKTATSLLACLILAIATLREMCNLKPTAPFHAWLMEHGIMDESGRLTKAAGDASIFSGR